MAREKFNFKLNQQTIGASLVIIIIVIALLISHRHGPTKSSTQHYFPASITTAQVNIPVFYPTNLPSGFKVSNAKVIRQNILNYEVISSDNSSFFVTIQALPTNFNFAAFKDKFNQPDQYNVPIGTAVVGQIGNSLIGSIQTNKNDWILLSSPSISKQTEMEMITRALQPVNL